MVIIYHQSYFFVCDMILLCLNDYVVTCRSPYTGLQYPYAISNGKVGRRARFFAKCAARACWRATRVLICGQILFRAWEGRRGSGRGAQLAVWEVGYASAGERTLSGSTPALYSAAAPLRSLRHSLVAAI